MRTAAIVFVSVAAFLVVLTFIIPSPGVGIVGEVVIDTQRRCAWLEIVKPKGGGRGAETVLVPIDLPRGVEVDYDRKAILGADGHLVASDGADVSTGGHLGPGRLFDHFIRPICPIEGEETFFIRDAIRPR